MRTILSRFKRRYQIFKAILQQGNRVEQIFPDAALLGIGFNTVWWAALEHQLDLFIYWHSITRMGDNRPDHPRALVKKLDYIKTQVERDETLSADDRAFLRKLRLELAGISQERHDFTHSFMPINDPRDDWQFVRLRYEGKNVRAMRSTYNIEGLQALSQRIVEKVHQVSPFVQRHCEDWLKANRNLLMSSPEENPRPKSHKEIS